MKFKEFSLFCIMTVGSLNVTGQTSYLKGYYITHQQDTIRGFIDYHSENKNFSVCVFKSSPDAKPITHRPKDILGFAVDNTIFYESHSFENKRKKATETLFGFFKVIIKGKLLLLQYEDRFFMKNQNSEIFEITKKREIRNDTIKYDYYGMGMLIAYMKDCPEMKTELGKEYKTNPNFIRIFEKYYECIGNPFDQTKKITLKPHIAVGIQVACSATNLTFKSSLKNADLKNDLALSPGIFTSIFLPRLGDHLRLVIEGAYGRYTQYAYFSSAESNHDLFIDYSFIKAPILMRYNHKSFFLDFGIQNYIVIKQDTRWRVETMLENTVTTTEKQLAPLSTWNTGFLVGAGMSYNISDHILRSSLRFSKNQFQSHPEKPVFQAIELVLSFQLTR